MLTTNQKEEEKVLEEVHSRIKMKDFEEQEKEKHSIEQRTQLKVWIGFLQCRNWSPCTKRKTIVLIEKGQFDGLVKVMNSRHLSFISLFMISGKTGYRKLNFG